MSVALLSCNGEALPCLCGRLQSRGSCRPMLNREACLARSVLRLSVQFDSPTYGPVQNDLVLQLRKWGINKVILAGMSANLCVEGHLRELLEQGFELAVVADATAAGHHAPGLSPPPGT